MSKISVHADVFDVNALDPAVRDELASLDKHQYDNKDEILKLAKLAILDIDCSENILTSIDFLQCQVEHQSNQRKLVDAIRDHRHFREDFGDLRYMVRELQENIMESIRYGKRSARLDDMLVKLSSLIAIANQNPGTPSTVSLANAEGALSPRCSSCVAECRSAHRTVQTFVARLARSVATENENKSAKKK